MSMHTFQNGRCFSDDRPGDKQVGVQLSETAASIAGALVRVDPFETFAKREELCEEEEEDGATGRVPEVHVDNLCGSFQMPMDEVNVNMLRLAQHHKRQHFYSDNWLFHSIHGRLNFSDSLGTWTFKGVQCLRELAELVWELGVEPMERRALFAPTFRVRMLAVTLHYYKSIDPNVKTSLFWKVILAHYSCCLMLMPRTDESENLLFLKLTSWRHAMTRVATDFPHEKEGEGARIMESARQALEKLGEKAHPSASVGVTRNSVFFIRLVFPPPGLKAQDNTDLTPFLSLLVRLVEDILRHIGITPSRSLVHAAWE